MFSLKLFFKIIVSFGVLGGLVFVYIKNVLKLKAASKLGEKIEKNPDLAQELSNQLYSTIADFDCDYSILYEKLTRLKFEMDIYYHRIFKCHH